MATDIPPDIRKGGSSEHYQTSSGEEKTSFETSPKNRNNMMQRGSMP